jgi:hypothetical protein
MAALWYAVGVMNANAVKKLEFAFHGDSMNVLGAFIDGNKVKANTRSRYAMKPRTF